jgi:hypothetical protein
MLSAGDDSKKSNPSLFISSKATPLLEPGLFPLKKNTCSPHTKGVK